MNGFLFLLLTLSFLVLTQMQTGVLGSSPAAATTAKSGSSADRVAVTKATVKSSKSGAPALSNMDGGSVLFFLTNILIHLFYLR